MWTSSLSSNQQHSFSGSEAWASADVIYMNGPELKCALLMARATSDGFGIVGSEPKKSYSRPHCQNVPHIATEIWLNGWRKYVVTISTTPLAADAFISKHAVLAINSLIKTCSIMMLWSLQSALSLHRRARHTRTVVSLISYRNQSGQKMWSKSCRAY